jgi:hypothetical protein
MLFVSENGDSMYLQNVSISLVHMMQTFSFIFTRNNKQIKSEYKAFGVYMYFLSNTT